MIVLRGMRRSGGRITERGHAGIAIVGVVAVLGAFIGAALVEEAR